MKRLRLGRVVRSGPGGVSRVLDLLPDHGHTGANDDGGDLPGYLRLNRAALQTLSDSISVSEIIARVGLEVGTAASVVFSVDANGDFRWDDTPNIVTLIRATGGNYDCVLPAESGTLVVSSSIAAVSYDDDAVFYEGDLLTYA